MTVRPLTTELSCLVAGNATSSIIVGGPSMKKMRESRDSEEDIQTFRHSRGEVSIPLFMEGAEGGGHAFNEFILDDESDEDAAECITGYDNKNKEKDEDSCDKSYDELVLQLAEEETNTTGHSEEEADDKSLNVLSRAQQKHSSCAARRELNCVKAAGILSPNNRPVSTLLLVERRADPIFPRPSDGFQVQRNCEVGDRRHSQRPHHQSFRVSVSIFGGDRQED